MKNWRKVLVNRKTSIFDTVKILNTGSMQIALVVDEKDKLEGVICDGDIRRGILKGFQLSDSVENIMVEDPVFIYSDIPKSQHPKKFHKSEIRKIPIVTREMIVVDLLEFRDDEIVEKENTVVIMAGGLGQRLLPLTESTPKPLLHVGNKPILQSVIENLIAHNFVNFQICVNYKSEMIKDYFGDGNQFNANINYVHEEKRLGTAGALKLVPKGNTPLLVTNADLLTNLNFNELLESHQNSKAAATMCVRQYEIQVPYGVVVTEKGSIKAIDEKPIHKFLVNAGIYIINPEVIDLIPADSPLDMTELFEIIIKNNLKTSLFPIHEYWLDIGKIDDFKRAQLEYSMHFGVTK